MSVAFCTHCHEPHLHKLHAPGVLEEMVGSHRYPFDEIIVVHQRCRGVQYRPFDYLDLGVLPRVVESESHPDILTDFDISEDPKADDLTHGPTALHYWKWHVINHLIHLRVAESEYIVFSDCDCIIKETLEKSWVEEGIEILESYPEVLLVAPGEGGPDAEGGVLPNGARLTRGVSQQLFMVDKWRFTDIDFDIPWDWEFLAPYGPMQEFYYMLEGRIWRYLERENLWRAVLPDKWRYWHYSIYEPQGWVEAGRPS